MININYLNYKEHDIKNFILTEDEINKKISIFLENKFISVYKKGKTTDNKDIYALQIGNGELKIFIWAGKHGNEHTGITSLFDFVNYVTNINISKFTFVIVFCLNIDGLSQFTRVNLLNIDINRDALSLTSTESLFFMSIIKDFNPYLCISLHDQRSIFNTKNNNKPAILSFLSASENVTRDITPNRKYIMSLISHINDSLQLCIGAHTGRYTDEFYPTAFGDNLMKMGYKNILIESGISYTDYFREKTRKYTFLSLVSIINFLDNEDENLKKIDFNNYFNIPENDNKMIDIIVRNAIINHTNKDYKVDIGVSLNISPNEAKNDIKKNYTVINIGDLSQYYGHIEIDAKNNIVKNKDNSIISLNTEVKFDINNVDFYNYVN